MGVGGDVGGGGDDLVVEGVEGGGRVRRVDF